MLYYTTSKSSRHDALYVYSSYVRELASDALRDSRITACTEIVPLNWQCASLKDKPKQHQKSASLNQSFSKNHSQPNSFVPLFLRLGVHSAESPGLHSIDFSYCGSWDPTASVQPWRNLSRQGWEDTQWHATMNLWSFLFPWPQLTQVMQELEKTDSAGERERERARERDDHMWMFEEQSVQEVWAGEITHLDGVRFMFHFSCFQGSVQDHLGPEFIEQLPFDMMQTYEETTCLTPIFFVLFPGSSMVESRIQIGWIICESSDWWDRCSFNMYQYVSACHPTSGSMWLAA